MVIFYQEYNALENIIKYSCLNLLYLPYVHILCIYLMKINIHQFTFVVAFFIKVFCKKWPDLISLLSYHVIFGNFTAEIR